MKAKRQPTAEQKQAAADRRARFTELAKHVAEMSEDERTTLVMKVGAIVTCEGRALSVHNTCLVLTQLPTASMVGGFQQWKAHGRSVKKGEHGLMIWIPTGKGEKGEPTIAEPTATADGGEEKGRRSGFIMGTVFDISQTEETATRGATATAIEPTELATA